MSVAEQLAATAAKNSTPDAAPPLGQAPQTKIEVDAAQQVFEDKKQEMTQERAINKMRFEQLSGAIFARLFSESGVLENALDVTTGEVNKDVLHQIIQLCNILSSHAAMGHATSVWQIPVGEHQPTPQPGQPAQQPPAQ
jgi:maltooligosyltrehalose synthase